MTRGLVSPWQQSRNRWHDNLGKIQVICGLVGLWQQSRKRWRDYLQKIHRIHGLASPWRQSRTCWHDHVRETRVICALFSPWQFQAIWQYALLPRKKCRRHTVDGCPSLALPKAPPCDCRSQCSDHPHGNCAWHKQRSNRFPLRTCRCLGNRQAESAMLCIDGQGSSGLCFQLGYSSLV